MDDLNSLIASAPSSTIAEAFCKSYSKIHSGMYKKIMVSVSGGSDSDIMMDMIERIGHPNSDVVYVFYDTGIEYEATKRHLELLENKYGVEIQRRKAVMPVPLGTKKYGEPFLSKQISEYIERLQLHDFKWEDEPFDVLYERYPNCKVALRWWCNEWGADSRMNICKRRGLKEYMISNPPNFRISPRCCEGAKKRTAHKYEKEYDPDLTVIGVRRAEGGVRSTAYKSCFDHDPLGRDSLRPIFWFTNEDKQLYENTFGVTHSDCYIRYGLRRTGCAGCPFGMNYETELDILEKYEPKLFNAVQNIFPNSYAYTKGYRDFQKGE